MRCYRRVLEESGSSATTCFNLANVLYRLRRKVEAVELYRQALEFDDEASETWNNLGVVLCELKQCDEATHSFIARLRQLHGSPTRSITWPIAWTSAATPAQPGAVGRIIYGSTCKARGAITPARG